MRIAHITDTHLSAAATGPRAGRAREAWPALLAQLCSDPPDLVVHTGDLILLDPDSTVDRDFARHAARDVPAPMLVVPGNHDVGDHHDITAHRLERYQAAWGPDRWVQRPTGLRLIGFNSLLLGSGTPAEDEQWEWLEGELGEPTHEPTALFCHQPLVLAARDEPDSWATPPVAARRRLLDLLRTCPAQLHLVAGGHVHRHRDITVDGIRHVTAPSPAYAVPELVNPGGDQRTGHLRYELRPGGDLEIALRTLDPLVT